MQYSLTSNIEHLKLQVKDQTSVKELLQTKKDTEIEELKANITLKVPVTQTESSVKTSLQEREQFNIWLANERSKLEVDLERETEANQRVTNEK